MGDTTTKQASEAAQQFAIEGTLQEMSHVKTGHINETFRSRWLDKTTGETRTFIHQCMNGNVFPNVPAVLENVRLITQHLKLRLLARNQGEETLQTVRTRGGEHYWCSPQGSFWRTFVYVDESEGFDVSPSLAHAQAVGEAFGRFLSLLSDFDTALLVEPIPGFQNVEMRFSQFEEALKADPLGRAKDARDLIEFVLSQRHLAGSFSRGVASGEIPQRVTHADPKVNNVLFSIGTTKVRCVVDLDTCMVGTSLYDFGDMVRSAGVPVEEDEQDLNIVRVDPGLFGALTKGYLSETSTLLTPAEIKLLPIAPGVIGLSLGMRFLGDHLLGDRYFRVHYEGQNLARARTQLAITRSVLENQAALASVVQACLSGRHLKVASTPSSRVGNGH